MKILVVGLNYEEGFARFIAEEFGAMGHAVTIFDPQTRTANQESRTKGKLAQVKKQVHALLQSQDFYQKMFERNLFDLVAAKSGFDLTVVCSDFLYPRTVAELKRRYGMPVVLWFPDAIWSFGRHTFLDAQYDALFFKDPYIVEELRLKLSLPVYYLPECYSPRALCPVKLSDDDLRTFGCDITTAGNLYPYRLAFLSEIKDFDVKIWGNPLPSWALADDVRFMIQNRFVAGEAKSKAFCGARIVLNNLHPAEIWGINVRAFEIAGAGGFQMIDWRPGLSQLFDDGREVVSFRDRYDLQHKIKRYLAAPDERAEIAAAGHRRAAAEHTYRHRLTLMLKTVFESDVSGYPVPPIRCESEGR
jgi:spore maturation protein CgeB